MSFSWNRNAAVRPNSLIAPRGDTVMPFGAGPGAPAAPSNAQRASVARFLVGLWEYLKENAPRHPQLAGALQEMQSAVAAYQADSSPDPWAPVKRVMQAIEVERQSNPSIPQP